MPFLETGVTILEALNNLGDLVKKLGGSKDSNAIETQLTEMTRAVRMAEQDALGLVQQINTLQIENRSLNEKLSDRTRFEEQADKYRRTHTETGATVYVEKEPPEDEEHTTYFCAQCYINGKLSILQPTETIGMSSCNTCKSTIKTTNPKGGVYVC